MNIRARAPAVFFVLAGILFSRAQVYALTSEMKAIRDLETQEKTPPPADIFRRPAVRYTGDNFRDPFQKLIRPADADSTVSVVEEDASVRPPAFAVTGIIWGGIFPVALIDGEVVKAGDTLKGATVTRIDKSGVSFIFQEKAYNLPAPSAADTGA